MAPFVLALVPWVAVAAVRAKRHSSHQKRQRPGPVRDQILPEEMEAHFDLLRKVRSDERKAFRP